MRRLLIAVTLLLAVACSGAPADIRTRLAAIPGLRVSEQPTDLPGYRFFVMTYEQPQDHFTATQSIRFDQRLTLLHRDDAAPMILFSSGYFVSTRGARTELTVMTGANQLSVEHRFFEPSLPDPPDWSALTIEQAAADHHRIVEAFRPIYRGRWISTGGSKGGMTALFHRRFYPDDVYATVPYVAPLTYAADAAPGPDNRYRAFLAQVGPDPACRQALADFQRLVLTRADDLYPMMETLATEVGSTFDTILGKVKALEFAVIEAPFFFWQYGTAAGCAGIPGATATSEEVFAFLDAVTDLAFFTDGGILLFLAYFHQSATQLGYPLPAEEHLADLLSFPGQDQPPAYLPPEIPVGPYDPDSMVDIQSWISRQGERLLFVYGEYDPWAAGAVELGGARDSFLFTGPAGNHRVRIANLPAADQAAIVAALSRWAGVTAQVVSALERRRLPTEVDPLDEIPGRGMWRNRRAATSAIDR